MSANQSGIYGTYYAVFFAGLILEFSNYNLFPEENDAGGYNRLILLGTLSASVVIGFTVRGFYSSCKGEKFLEWYYDKPMGKEVLNDRLRSFIRNGEDNISPMNERSFKALLDSIQKNIISKTKIKQQKNSVFFNKIPAMLYTATWDSIQGTILYWLLSGALKVIDSSVINLAYFNGLAIVLKLPGNLLENVFKAEGLQQEPEKWHKNLQLLSIIASNFIDATNQLITIDNLFGPAFVAVIKDQYRSEQAIDLGGFNYLLTVITLGLTAFIISRNVYRNYNYRDHIIDRIVKFYPPQYNQSASQVESNENINTEMQQINTSSQLTIITTLNKDVSFSIHQKNKFDNEDNGSNDIKEFKVFCEPQGQMSIFIYKPDQLDDQASFTKKLCSYLPTKCCG
ncbi:MAG: hypothetical protein GY821_03075 [Gammaproteobacteria bacterium]|nr:hypothetical protein [Gammaproteobacteria bacterium]